MEKNKVLPSFPEPFSALKDAITRAKELTQSGYLVIVLKSKPTEAGQCFYVEDIDTLIRTWEVILWKSKTTKKQIVLYTCQRTKSKI